MPSALALRDVHVAGLAADERLVHFDFAAELAARRRCPASRGECGGA